jgi:hypothetical protein
LKTRIVDARMNDGTRRFGELPETYDVTEPQWHKIRDHVARLPGATLAGFVTDDVAEAWVDFDFASHRFSMHNPDGRWWFFVSPAECPEPVLERVLDHFASLLDPALALARAAGPRGASAPSATPTTRRPRSIPSRSSRSSSTPP